MINEIKQLEGGEERRRKLLLLEHLVKNKIIIKQAKTKFKRNK